MGNSERRRAFDSAVWIVRAFDGEGGRGKRRTSGGERQREAKETAFTRWFGARESGFERHHVSERRCGRGEGAIFVVFFSDGYDSVRESVEVRAGSRERVESELIDEKRRSRERGR